VLLQAASDAQALPVLKGPVDVMRNGAVAFKQTVLTAHPVESIQKTVRIRRCFSSCNTKQVAVREGFIGVSPLIHAI
jgi:hypothetical protein